MALKPTSRFLLVSAALVGGAGCGEEFVAPAAAGAPDGAGASPLSLHGDLMAPPVPATTTEQGALGNGSGHDPKVIYLRYEGLVNPKHGGDPYHGWRLEVDRDETTNPSYLPWASEPATRDTVADQMTPTDTGPPAQPGDGAPVGESFYTTTASDDDIPF